MRRFKFVLIKLIFLLHPFHILNKVSVCFLIFFKGFILIDCKKEGLKNNNFFVLINKEKEKVWKIPKYNNPKANRLFLNLLKKEEKSNFKQILSSLNHQKYLKNHTTEVLKIFKSNGYISPFVEGYNLGQILINNEEFFNDFKKKVKKQVFKNASKELISNLEQFKIENNFIPGDWAPHNLIFDKKTEKIINVDLEGFYNYRYCTSKENDLNYLRQNLNQIYEKM